MLRLRSHTNTTQERFRPLPLVLKLRQQREEVHQRTTPSTMKHLRSHMLGLFAGRERGYTHGGHAAKLRHTPEPTGADVRVAPLSQSRDLTKVAQLSGSIIKQHRADVGRSQRNRALTKKAQPGSSRTTNSGGSAPTQRNPVHAVEAGGRFQILWVFKIGKHILRNPLKKNTNSYGLNPMYFKHSRNLGRSASLDK